MALSIIMLFDNWELGFCYNVSGRNQSVDLL